MRRIPPETQELRCHDSIREVSMHIVGSAVELERSVKAMRPGAYRGFQKREGAIT